MLKNSEFSSQYLAHLLLHGPNLALYMQKQKSQIESGSHMELLNLKWQNLCTSTYLAMVNLDKAEVTISYCTLNRSFFCISIFPFWNKKNFIGSPIMLNSENTHNPFSDSKLRVKLKIG